MLVYVKQYPKIAIGFTLISCIITSHAVASLWVNMARDMLSGMYAKTKYMHNADYIAGHSLAIVLPCPLTCFMSKVLIQLGKNI